MMIISRRNIGSGTFGRVYEGTFHGRPVAIKTIPFRTVVDRSNVIMVNREIAVWKHLTESGCKHIVPFIDCQVDNDAECTHLISELAGQTLQVHVNPACACYKLDEDQKIRAIRDTLLGVCECHAVDVVHCDIKPRNVVDTGSTEKEWKLIDFGHSQFCSTGSYGLTARRFTPFYMAPEILRYGSYGKSVDMWAIGIIAFALHSYGKHPMMDKSADSLSSSVQMIYNAIVKGVIDWDMCESHNAHLADFIKHCLDTNPSNRIEASEALLHPLFSTSDIKEERNVVIQ